MTQIFVLNHMLISQKQLKKVMVETQSGRFLGYVIGFELETDTGVVEKYYVKGKIIPVGFWGKSLLINKSQIINFDKDKMVVDDAVVKTEAGKLSKLVRVEKLESSKPVITEEL